MSMLQQYAPKDVVVAFDGVNINGFAEDTMVAITRNDDLVNEVVGAQGDLQITINHNNTAEIVFSLLQNSLSNIDLESYYMDNQGTNFATIASISVAVPASGIIINCRNSYLKGTPEFAFGSDNSDREWTFGCEYIEVVREEVSIQPV
jgi:hypothetical protein